MAERDPSSSQANAAQREDRRRWRWPWVVLVVVLCAGGGAWWWRHTHATAQPTADAAAGGSSHSKASGWTGRGGAGAGGASASRAIPVQAAPVTKGDMHIYFSALGTVTSPNSVVVRPRVDGQLMRIAVKEGDLVKAGQLIAEIDPRPFQVALEQAQGQLARDTAQLENARLNLTRYQTLLQQQSIAPQQVETQEALVRQYEGTIKADQAAVDSAKLQLVYSRVVSPVSGRLGLRAVDAGNIVRASDTTGIITVNQVQPIDVLFTLPETQLPTVMKPLQSGDAMRVEAWNREQTDRLAVGRVASLDNQIDTTTGTVKLKARFDNGDLALFPNQFVNVKLLADTHRDATLAPAAAVQRGRTGAFVYVIKQDNTVTLRPVKLGETENGRIEVLDGLAPGESVVTDGIDQLREGATVEVADASSLLTEQHRSGRRRGDGASAPVASADAARSSAASSEGAATGNRSRSSDSAVAADRPRKPDAARAANDSSRDGNWAGRTAPDASGAQAERPGSNWRAERGDTNASAPRAAQ